MTEHCQCELAGWCERHKLNKSIHTHQLCKTHQNYRALWDSLVGIAPFVQFEPKHEVIPKTSISPHLDCIHRGLPLREERCQLCGTVDRMETIHYCGLFNECSLRRYKTGTKNSVPNCLDCSYRSPSIVDLPMPHHKDLTEASPIPWVKQLLAQPPGPWPANWFSWENIAQAWRELFDEASKRIPPAPRWDAERGIVICGGGWRFFFSICVTVRVIRSTGCKLPIQVWYLGDKKEFDPRMEAALRDYDVGWICANSFVREQHLFHRILDGWELKALAAAYCPFKEVIFMDADCYPAYNPEDFMRNPEYQRVGASFWPDWKPLESGQWQRFGLPPADSARTSFESGQFIIDKSRHWEPTWLAYWINCYSDYVYKHIYGDKDTFNIAWVKASHETCVPQKTPIFRDGVAYVHRDFEGKPLFIHRCRDKFRIVGEMDGVGLTNPFMTPQATGNRSLNKYCPNMPQEERCHKYLKEADKLLRPQNFFTPAQVHDPWATWNEVNLFNVYKLPSTLDTRPIILDIGANNGASMYAFLKRGASKVIGVDPFLENIAAIRKNLVEFIPTSWATIHGALHDRDELVQIYNRFPDRDDMTCSSLHQSFSSNPGIEVAGKSWQTILGTVGRFDWLKLDCEGGEWVLARNKVVLQAHVTRVIGELHTFPNHQEPQEFWDWLKENDFQVTTQVVQIPTPENPVGTFLFWANR